MRLKISIVLITILLLSIRCFTANAKVFDMIVDAAGRGDYTTIQAALNAVPSNSSTRTLIFVRNGTYSEKVEMASTKIAVSLIGENVDSVVIVTDNYVGKILSDGTTISGYQKATTFRALASDFYAENITFENSSGNVGQALAISTEADKQVYKNCKFIGFQDTYRAAKKRQYNFKCYIEGGTDFIYADAQSLFDQCTINCLKGGSYVSAPGEATVTRTINGTTYYLGLLFSQCKITANSDVSAKSYYLGRPWGDKNASSVFVNCTLGSHIKAEGWTTMGTTSYLTAFMAEYKSVNTDSSLCDVSSRVSWSKQLSDEVFRRCYSPDSFLIQSNVVWNPRPLTQTLATPTGVTVSDTSIHWDAVENAIGYVVYKNGSFLGVSETNSYGSVSAISSSDVILVKSVRETGALSTEENDNVVGKKNYSLNSSLAISIADKCASSNKDARFQIYNSKGQCVLSTSYTRSVSLNGMDRGIYIIRATCSDGTFAVTKIGI